MEKLYYERPYVKNFEARVLECRPGKEGVYEIILDRTAFYPEGGGQPADRGSLGEAQVLDVKERGEEILHITDRPLEAGSSIEGAVDWSRRLNHMQNHSGEHILSGIVHKHYGLDNVGFHMGKDEVTVDFNGTLTMEQIEAAEEEANEIIWRNVPILESFPSKEELSAMDYRSKKELSGQVRIIEIPGTDVCACCGTHVANTGEIGMLKVTGMTRYKGGVRVSMLCGIAAFEDYRAKQRSVTGISVLLSAKPRGILEAVEKLKAEGAAKEERISGLYEELLERRAGEYEKSSSPLAVLEDGLGPVQLRQLCTRLYEEEKGSIVLVCSGEEGLYQYALGSAHKDMKAFCRTLNERLEGRGGGSPLMAQGTFRASWSQIQKAFEEEAGRQEWN